MTRRVVFRPEAEDEVLATRRWYEERREGLGVEFASAVDAMVERIVTSPLVFPCAYGETRRAVLGRFPYAIYFRVLTALNKIPPFLGVPGGNAISYLSFLHGVVFRADDCKLVPNPNGL